MKELQGTSSFDQGRKKLGLLLPVFVIWSLGALVTFFLLGLDSGLTEGLGELYLLPWAALTGIVLLSPSAFLYFRGEFDLFHPLVYGVWSYMFPAFVLGAVILTFGWSDPYFLAFIEDPQFNIPLSLVYVCIGFLGLVAGYYLPIGRYASGLLERIAPKWEWDHSSLWLPGLFLVFCGVAINVMGFLQGLLGYQRVDEIGVFDSLVVYLAAVLTAGSILLWIFVFKAEEKEPFHYLLIAFLVALIPLKMFMLGSRGSLMTSVIPIAFAYWHSGKRFTVKQLGVFGVLLAIAISIGVIYGTSFRNIRGSEERINAGDYIGQISETIDYISRVENTRLMEQSAMALAARIENLSSLAVVVANHEKLEPFEENYGLKNNILNDLLTAFIPRFLWADKPMTSDPRAYGELYFNFGENSFAITPFGDLLRNFGIIGIPLGMMIIGFYLRILYEFLIKTDRPAVWKTVAYYPMLTVVTYEAFYAVMFPSMIRVLLIVGLSLIAANFLVRQTRPAY